ncbi:hypothetical protein NHG34_05365 [Aerococcaceae bacterium NML190938]|nr:hypothetical protein [Aerococcaceae bacterium NML190938]
MREDKTHKLHIKGRKIYLDGKELKKVTHYELKSRADNKLAQLTVEMLVIVED